MDEPAVVDHAAALDRADGDREFFLALAKLFLQESPKEAAAARAALDREDQAGLVAAVHKLKGSVVEICAPRLYECAKRLEELGRQGALTEASCAYGEVEIRLAEVHAALRNLIAGGFPS